MALWLPAGGIRVSQGTFSSLSHYLKNIYTMNLISSLFLLWKYILFNICTYYIVLQKSEVKFLVWQVGLGSAGAFISHQ